MIMHGNSLSQKITVATILAQDQLEAVHNAAYDQLTSTTETMTTDNGQRYIRVMDVIDNKPMRGMKTVSIAVHWARRNSKNRHVSLQTIVTDDRR